MKKDEEQSLEHPWNVLGTVNIELWLKFRIHIKKTIGDKAVKMLIFMFKEFGLYLVSNGVFWMGFEQGSIMIKVALFESRLHDNLSGGPTPLW